VQSGPRRGSGVREPEDFGGHPADLSARPPWRS